MRNSLAKNTLFNVMYKVLNVVFPMITTVYLSRVLGPIYIGRVSYAQTILSYFLAFASLGIPTYGIREIARVANDRVNTDKTFSELFILNGVSTIVCSVIYSGIVLCIPRFNNDVTLYLCVGLTLYLNVINVDWFYSGKEEYVYIAVRSSIIKLLSLFALFLFVRKKEDYIIYATISSLAVTGNYFLNVYNLKSQVRFRTSGLEIKKHLKPVIVLLVTMLATDLYNQVDITMIGAIRTEYEVGCYSNGIKLIRIIYSITTAICATILPMMSVYFKEDKIDKMKEQFRRTSGLIILISLPAVIGLFTVSDKLVYVLMGEEFAATGDVIRILAPMVLVITLSYLSGSVMLSATNNEKFLLLATSIGAIVNIVFNSILIPSKGIYGAAMASVLAELVVFIVHVIMAKRYISYTLGIRYYISVFIASISIIPICSCLDALINNSYINLSVTILLSILAYFAILIVFKNPVMNRLILVFKNKLD